MEDGGLGGVSSSEEKKQQDFSSPPLGSKNWPPNESPQIDIENNTQNTGTCLLGLFTERASGEREFLSLSVVINGMLVIWGLLNEWDLSYCNDCAIRILGMDRDTVEECDNGAYETKMGQQRYK